MLIQLGVFVPFSVFKSVLNPVGPAVADPRKLVRVAVAKKLEYEEFQANTEARMLDGTGAIVALAEEQPAESKDRPMVSKISVRLSASSHQMHLYLLLARVPIIEQMRKVLTNSFSADI